MAHRSNLLKSSKGSNAEQNVGHEACSITQRKLQHQWVPADCSSVPRGRSPSIVPCYRTATGTCPSGTQKHLGTSSPLDVEKSLRLMIWKNVDCCARLKRSACTCRQHQLVPSCVSSTSNTREAPVFGYTQHGSGCSYLRPHQMNRLQEYMVYTDFATYITLRCFRLEAIGCNASTLMVSLVITVGKKPTHVIFRVILFTLLLVVAVVFIVTLGGRWCLPTSAFSLGRGAHCRRLYCLLHWVQCIPLYVTYSSCRRSGSILIAPRHCVFGKGW